VIRRPGPASELLAQLCERLAEREDLRGERMLADVAVQCRQPLRVMVAGDVSVGKSTLINAMLGQRLAESGRAETTAELTWYRHPDLADDPLPGIRNRVIDVRFPLVDRIILVDSPGLNTTSGAQSFTLDVLSGGSDSSGGAGALVYLTIGELSEEGYERIDDFAALGSSILGSLGNIVLVAGKAETVSETSARDRVAGKITETVEQAAAKTEERLRARDIAVRTVAVSQHLAMVARCGEVTGRHVDLVHEIMADAGLRRFMAHGWAQLDKAWTARGRSTDELGPLRSLFPDPRWLVTALADVSGLDVAALSACCERVSRFRHLERILTELADDADLLTAATATARLRRWAGGRGRLRGTVIREQLRTLWTRPEFAGFDRRRAALLLGTTIMGHIPADDRTAAIALLRGECTAGMDQYWASAARQWQLRTTARQGGSLGDVAQIVAKAASQYVTRPRGGAACRNSS
jgi:GTPase SAR1 family protein